MRKGNVKSAVTLLTYNTENGKLHLNDRTTKLLKQKHLRSADVSEDVLLPNEAGNVYFIKCKSYNAKPVWEADLKIREDQGHPEWMLMIGDVYFYHTILDRHQLIYVEK